MTKTEREGLRILRADEGKVLAKRDGECLIICREAYLGKSDTAEAWSEIEEGDSEALPGEGVRAKDPALYGAPL